MYEFKKIYDAEDKALTLYHARQEHIDTLEYPDDAEELYIYGDFFDTITIPNRIKKVFCVDVALKTIHLPESVEDVCVESNKLTSLCLPKNIRKVLAERNLITQVTFQDGCDPVNLEDIDLEYNRLMSFHFIPPPCLKYVNIAHNDQLFKHCVSPEIMKIIETHDECFWGNVPTYK